MEMLALPVVQGNVRIRGLSKEKNPTKTSKPSFLEAGNGDPFPCTIGQW